MRLKLFAEGLDSLKRHKTLNAGERALTLKSVKPGSAGAIARFAEIADRGAAEALRGTLLTVPRAALPPLEEGEYYHADLIGLACETQPARALGTVVAVENFGAGDLLEIERPDGKRALIPFQPRHRRPGGRQDRRRSRLPRLTRANVIAVVIHVIPAKAGIPLLLSGGRKGREMPAFAGMTNYLLRPPSSARSLRIVVAATPPSPMAWLIWSRPITTSPAA